MLIKLLHRHGICPDCAEALYPDIALYDGEESPGNPEIAQRVHNPQERL